ncbi:hypothetical protein [Streptomyces sp. NPDC001889]
MDLLFRSRRPGRMPAFQGVRRFDVREVDEAGAEVARALRRLGLSPVLATGSGTVVTVAIPDSLPTTLLGVPAVPLNGHEEATIGALEQALLQRGVRTRVTVIDLDRPAPQITFTTPADARAFAQLIERELPPAQRAAEQLRAALHRAGVTTAAPSTVLGVVTVGAVSAPQARLLYRLLGGQAVDLPDHPRRHGEDLASQLASVLAAVLPEGPAVRVAAEPDGADCPCALGIILGEVLPVRARQLADAVEAATARLLLPAVLPRPRTGTP